MEIITLVMESEVLDRFKSFSFSNHESQGVELEDEDVKIGVEEGKRS